MERVKAGNSRDQSRKDGENVVVEMKREIICIFTVELIELLTHAVTRTHNLSHSDVIYDENENSCYFG